MTEKFSLNDLFMRIMPGGALIGIIYFVYHEQLGIELTKELDFFIHFCFLPSLI